jgi:ABC-type enterobactin transport system permease subunit
MLAILKRYSMAFVFLLLMVILMLAATMGVMSFGDSMVQEMGIEMKPRGEDLIK